MSFKAVAWPEPDPVVASAVRRIFRRKDLPLAVAVRDEFGELFSDALFAEAFERRGRPAWSPGRLALVTVLQKTENLTDRAAEHAVATRLDWRYALGLGLDEDGFDASVLSEFRTRVVEHHLEERVLDALLAALAERGLVAAGGKQRTDSAHVICAVRDLNRLELCGEAVRAAAEALAAAAPGWLAEQVDVADWSVRYERRVDSWLLPTSKTKRDALALAYGQGRVGVAGRGVRSSWACVAGGGARGAGVAGGHVAELRAHHRCIRAGGGQAAGGGTGR